MLVLLINLMLDFDGKFVTQFYRSELQRGK